MAVIFSTIFMIVALIFGGTQVAVAQSSMPDDALYPVKLASEDVRASLPSTNQARVDLAMDFADLRLQEALQLALEGKPIPATVWEHMDSHLDLGLNTAAGLNDDQLAKQLLQMQSRMQAELDKLAQLKADSRYGSAIESAQAALLTRMQLITIGMADPAAFREYMQADQRHSHWQLDPTATDQPTSTATAQPTDPAPTSTATPLPTSTATTEPTSTATAQPKLPATQTPNPGTNPNGHPHGCCCPWCMGHYGNTSGGYGGNWGGNNDRHEGGGWHR